MDTIVTQNGMKIYVTQNGMTTYVTVRRQPARPHTETDSRPKAPSYFLFLTNLGKTLLK